MTQNSSLGQSGVNTNGRKAYAKPNIQVYGTVAQLSEATNADKAYKLDGKGSGNQRT
ncbi:MAG TPA: hypothetical protein VGS41_19360 [Chthonomonadales bacterium]|nr:hypothetical protein [Chthonomonadales bacterium]